MIKGQILTYLYWLIGLLVVFVGVFAFFAVKIKRDDFSEEAEGLKQIGSQHRRLRNQLSESQKKEEILEHYLSLSEQARKEVLEQLESQTNSKKLSND